MIIEHLTEFAGLPVADVDPYRPPHVEPGSVAWRLAVDFDTPPERFAELFEALLTGVDPAAIRALVVGQWGDVCETPPPIESLVEFAPRLTGLRALFVGELTVEESEISWIQQADPAPLLDAYPELEVLRLRGAAGLSLTPLRHGSLRELAFESGGLPAQVVCAVGETELPALEHLELWLGTDDYHGDATVDDLAPVLAGDRLPALGYLGLRDAQIADEIAAALANAPVVTRLHSLDLSMGTLGDDGARALLAGQPLTGLRRLDLHHHYIGPELRHRLVAELPGVEVDLSGAERADQSGRRYVEVSE